MTCWRMLAALVLFAVMFAVSEDARAVSPDQTIRNIQTSIDQRDVASFEKLVDVDQLVLQVVNAILDNPETLNEVQVLPMVAGLVAAAQDPAMRVALSTLLLREFRAFTVYGIRSGHFAGKAVGKVQAEGLLAPMLPSIAPGRKTIAVAGSARKDGQDRIIPVRLTDEGSGDSVTTTVRLVRQGNSWQVTEFADMSGLLADVLAQRDDRHQGAEHQQRPPAQRF